MSEPTIYTGKVIPCPVCSKTVAATAKTCPNCGGRIKKSKKSLFILLGLLGFSGFVFISTIDQSMRDLGMKTVSSKSTASKVVYEVTGTAKTVSLTYENSSGGTEQTNESLPFTRELISYPGDFLYISAQNQINSAV